MAKNFAARIAHLDSVICAEMKEQPTLWLSDSAALRDAEGLTEASATLLHLASHGTALDAWKREQTIVEEGEDMCDIDVPYDAGDVQSRRKRLGVLETALLKARLELKIEYASIQTQLHNDRTSVLRRIRNAETLRDKFIEEFRTIQASHELARADLEAECARLDHPARLSATLELEHEFHKKRSDSLAKQLSVEEVLDDLERERTVLSSWNEELEARKKSSGITANQGHIPIVRFFFLFCGGLRTNRQYRCPSFNTVLDASLPRRCLKSGLGLE